MASKTKKSDWIWRLLSKYSLLQSCKHQSPNMKKGQILVHPSVINISSLITVRALATAYTSDPSRGNHSCERRLSTQCSRKKQNKGRISSHYCKLFGVKRTPYNVLIQQTGNCHLYKSDTSSWLSPFLTCMGFHCLSAPHYLRDTQNLKSAKSAREIMEWWTKNKTACSKSMWKWCHILSNLKDIYRQEYTIS